MSWKCPTCGQWASCWSPSVYPSSMIPKMREVPVKMLKINTQEVIPPPTKMAITQTDKTFGLGKVLSDMRKMRLMKQTDLAELSGVNRSSVNNIENGRQTLMLDVLISLSDALGFEVVIDFKDKKSSTIQAKEKLE